MSANSSFHTPQPWLEYADRIEGFLIDIYGVLYEGNSPIKGSIDAIIRLRAAGIPMRFCTNTSARTVQMLSDKLTGLGFSIPAEELFPPVPAACALLKQRNLRPFLLIKDGVRKEFADINQENPNCVVIGDACENYTYDSLNKAFQILKALDKPVLIAMGKGKYYNNPDGLQLDVGPFMKALEYACDIEAEVVGKPSPAFFMTPLADMNINPDQAVMIGDDIEYDIGGAQACGMKGVQVRTGKYRSRDEPHPFVRPDGYVTNIAEAVDLFLEARHKMSNSA